MSDDVAAVDGPAGIFAQFAEHAAAEKRASEGYDLFSIAEKAAAEFDEAQEEAAAAAAAAERAAAAEARRKVQERTRIVIKEGGKDKGDGTSDGPNQGFPLGRLVKVLQPIVMRGSEEVSSAETGKLTKGQECWVLARGVEKGGRRLLVKEPDSGMKGWVSCSTKTNKALLELLPGTAVPVEELDPSMTDLAKMPTVEEVLARIDGSGKELQNAEEQQEAEAEAIAVWRSFTDLAIVDEGREGEEDPRDFDPRCVHARARDQQMQSGELLCLVAPEQLRVEQTQDLHVKLLEKDRERKASREQQMKEKLKEALAPRARGLMPKMRGICPRSGLQGSASGAGPSHGGISHYSTSLSSSGAQFRARPSSWPDAPMVQQPPRREACLQSIQELRWQLQAERRQACQDEDAPNEPEIQPVEDASTPLEAEYDGGAADSGLFPLAVVRVDGLKSAVEFNGLRGVCQSQDHTGRWVVRFDSGRCKKFRHENLVLWEDDSHEEPSAGGVEQFGAAWFGQPEPDDKEPPSGESKVEQFGAAWFGQPEPDDEGGMEQFGAAWFGQPEPEEEGVPALEDLLKQLDGSGRSAPGNVQLARTEAAKSAGMPEGPVGLQPIETCKDYGQPEYWARLGLAPR